MAGLTKEQRAAKAAMHAAGADSGHSLAESFSALGVPMPASAAEFRALSESLVLREPDDGLTAMVKGGEELRVHPSCVKAHQAAGWHCKD